MTLHDFRSRLKQAHGSATTFTAQCPAHEDHRNSLSVTERDGKILLNCHAGCQTAAVVEALGLKMADLFTVPRQTRTASKPGRSGRGGGYGRIVKIYDYTLPDGTLLYQVCRMEPKDFCQRRGEQHEGNWVWALTEGEYAQWPDGGWRKSTEKTPASYPRRHFPAAPRRVLWNINAVIAAIAANRKIFIVEGEKDVETLTALGLTATTNMGGGLAWHADYTAALQGASVIIIPDNDKPGHERATRLARILPGSLILNLPGLPEKEDVSWWAENFPTPPGTADRPAILRRALIDLARRAAEDRAAAPLAPVTHETPDNPLPYRCLGYSAASFFLMSHRAQQVASFTAAGLGNRANLLSIAPLDHWETQADFMGDAGPRWTQIADHLMTGCYRAGVFSQRHRRGRGAWTDDGRTVLHQGDRLIVDGVTHDLLTFPSGYIYERAEPLRIPHSDPAPDALTHRFLELCSGLSWEVPCAGQLLAGWIAIAPICGALRWRPHIWVTGPAGSGKSWVLENIVNAILGGLALRVQSVTSEAGIRQALGTDALPVTFDEAEMEDERSRGNMQRVLELARQASSEGGAVIAKGSAGGTAQFYCIKSAFCLSAISVAVARAADESRVTVLSLTPGAGEAHFRKLRDHHAALMTGDFPAALIARSCRLAQVIRRNAETFAVAIANSGKTRRAGDQLGTLLAGYWSLWSSDDITLDAASSLVADLPLDDLTPAAETTDEARCLQYLLEQRVRFESQALKQTLERSIGELVEASAHGTDSFGAEAGQVLKRYGMHAGHTEGFMVSISHSGLATLLKNTPWGHKWHLFLKRLPGATAFPRVIRFTGGPMKAICIPWSIVDGPDGTERIVTLPAAAEDEELF